MDFDKLRADYLLGQFSSFLHSQNVVINSGSLLSLVILLPFLILVIFLIRRLFNIKRSLTELSVLLELTPPATTEKTSYTTQQLFSVIHDLGKQKGFKDRLLGRKNLFSFEIVSTQNQGIRYLIRTAPNEAANVKRSLLSYLPNL